MAPSDCRSLSQVSKAGVENCREALPRRGRNEIRQVAARSPPAGNAALLEKVRVTMPFWKPVIARRAQLADVPEHFRPDLDCKLQDGTRSKNPARMEMTWGAGETTCYKSRGNSRVVPLAPLD